MKSFFQIFFIYLGLFVFVTLIFSSGLSYMGQDTSSLFLEVIKNQTSVVLQSVFFIFFFIFLFLLLFTFLSHPFQKRIMSGLFLFFLFSLIFREVATYPALSENWGIYKNFSFIHVFIQNVSSLHENSFLRFLINWTPFCIVSLLFIYRIFYFKYSKNILFLLGVPLLWMLYPNFGMRLHKNKYLGKKPNVFIFAADSLRFDRLNSDKFQKVAPYLQSLKKNSAYFGPMLVGVPRTFPSWVEISQGKFAISTGIRTMFPSRGSRMHPKVPEFYIPGIFG